MTAHDDPGASARRIAKRAVLLLLPIVAVAIVAPRVLGHLRRDARLQAERLAGLHGGGAVPSAAGQEQTPPSKAPEAPTPEQVAAARTAQAELGKAQAGWEKVTVIMPRAARPGADGLETLPFEGFGLSVESVPEGAEVRVGGEPRGETPFLASVKCAPGSELEVRVEKPPLPAQTRKVRCRADTLVKLSVTLKGAGAR